MDGLTVKKSPAITAATASLFKTLGHPVRVLLLQVLTEGPATVNRLRDAAGVSSSNLSRHLSCLRAEKLITPSRSGGEVTYHVSCTEFATLLATARSVITAVATADRKVLEQARATARP